MKETTGGYGTIIEIEVYLQFDFIAPLATRQWRHVDKHCFTRGSLYVVSRHSIMIRVY